MNYNAIEASIIKIFINKKLNIKLFNKIIIIKVVINLFLKN